jgi:glycerol uptake facilitator-like aquaporin
MWALDVGVEFFGTLFFMACILLSGGHPVAIGAALAVAIWLGSMAGGKANNFNPAVSLAMLAKGVVEPARCATYVAAQVLGALAAVAVVAAVPGGAAEWLHLKQ